MSDRQELWRLPRKTLIDRIEQLEAVADAARHLLAGGDKEAVYHLEKALAALEGGDVYG